MAAAANFLVAGAALAAAECGPAAPSVTCSAAAYGNGIDYYVTPIGTLVLANPAMAVTGQGVLSGPRNTPNATSVMANQFASVKTSVNGFYGRGLMATSTGDATVEVTGGVVETTGQPAGGNAPIGVLAEVLGPGSGNALAVVNGTHVTTQGDATYGVMAYTGFGGTAAGSVTLNTTNAVVETAGVNAAALLAAAYHGPRTAPVSISMHGGSATTKGATSAALTAYSIDQSPVSVLVDGGGLVDAKGVDSPGVLAQSVGSTVDVKLLSGTVQAAGVNSAAVQVISGTTASVTNGGTLTSAAGDGIDASKATGGATITSSGNITATAAGAAVVRGSPVADSFTATAGALKGITLMDAGDDTVNLQGTVDVTGAPQFDGGAGVDTLNIAGLSMRGFTGANNPANGSNLTLWEAINVRGGGTLALTGDLFEPAAGAVLSVEAASTLDAKGSPVGAYTVNGDLRNGGTVTLADTPAAADDVLTVANHYTGVAGSAVLLNTVLGNSASASDRLVVQGDSSGASVLRISNAGGLGAATTGDGILVVQVNGASNAVFTLDGGTITAGAFTYSLHKVGNNWYLQSVAGPVVAVPTLGQFGLLVLAALLGAFGIRRQSRTVRTS